VLHLVLLVVKNQICAKSKGKGKVALALLTGHHASVLEDWRYSSTHSLTSALDGGEWSASRPGSFTPQGKILWYPLDRRQGGPRSRSGRGGEEKNSQPLLGSNPRAPIVQSVAQRYTTELSRLL
jgi:hypothetical protein